MRKTRRRIDDGSPGLGFPRLARLGLQHERCGQKRERFISGLSWRPFICRCDACRLLAHWNAETAVDVLPSKTGLRDISSEEIVSPAISLLAAGKHQPPFATGTKHASPGGSDSRLITLLSSWHVAAVADDMKMPINSGDVKWGPALPFPKGAEVAVLSGPLQRWSLRYSHKMPSSYKFPLIIING